MNETIRDRLKRRMWIAMGGNAVILVVWFLAMTFVVRPDHWSEWHTRSLGQHHSLIISLWCLIYLAVGGTWLFAISRLRCPTCGAIFGYQFGLRAGLGRPGPQRPDACPSCGTSLDTPWP